MQEEAVAMAMAVAMAVAVAVAEADVGLIQHKDTVGIHSEFTREL
jgi:hypothetical protein